MNSSFFKESSNTLKKAQRFTGCQVEQILVKVAPNSVQGPSYCDPIDELEAESGGIGSW